MRLSSSPPARRPVGRSLTISGGALAALFAVLPGTFGGLCGPAVAGTNQDGRIVLHAVPDINVTRFGEDRDLRSCEAAVSSLPGDESAVIIFALAAFPDWASPSWLGVMFGIDYDTALVASGVGPDIGFQLPGTGWPGPGSGVALTTGTSPPIEDRLTTLYWFAAYAYQGSSFVIVDNPASESGVFFADESIPSVLDRVRTEDRGRIGFGIPGYNPCLADLETGACCYETGVCTINAEIACEDTGGTYLGDDSACDPFACLGACCFEGACSQELPQDCERNGGWFRGVARSCTNTACLSERVTWGEIKQSYRRDYP